MYLGLAGITSIILFFFNHQRCIVFKNYQIKTFTYAEK